MANNDRLNTSDYDDFNYNYNFSSNNNNNNNKQKSSGYSKILLIFMSVILVLSVLTNIGVLYYFTSVANDEKTSTITPTNINDVASAIANNNMNSVVRINIYSRTEGTAGTGFVINDEGYIVTNYHVAKNLRHSDVYTGKAYFNWTEDEETGENNKGFKIKYCFGDSVKDVAVVQLVPSIDEPVIPNASDYKVVTFLNRNQKLNYGEKAVAIGNPLDLGFSVTEGIVSNPKIFIKESLTAEPTQAIQHTAEINGGNSGGPLYNKDGAVIGINTFKASQDSGGNVVEGMAYAVPNVVTLELLEKWGVEFTESELK